MEWHNIGINKMGKLPKSPLTVCNNMQTLNKLSRVIEIDISSLVGIKDWNLQRLKKLK